MCIEAEIIVEAISFRNSEGWSVFTGYSEETGNRNTCTGTLAEITSIGDKVKITGERVADKKWGEQIKCSSIIPVQPDTDSREGIVKVLCRLHGVGPAKAEKFYNDCEEKGLPVLETAIDDVCAVGVVPAIKDTEAKKLLAVVSDYDSLVYLLGIGLTNSQTNKLIRKYGKEAKDIVSRNPYQLIADIDGMGFLTVDAIAFKAGISAGNTARCCACIMYILNDSKLNGGNTWLAGWELVGIVRDYLYESAVKARADGLETIPGDDEIRQQIYFLQTEGLVVVENGKVYDSDLRDDEKLILDALGV